MTPPRDNRTALLLDRLDALVSCKSQEALGIACDLCESKEAATALLNQASRRGLIVRTVQLTPEGRKFLAERRKAP